jgi:hypothetical protein
MYIYLSADIPTEQGARLQKVKIRWPKRPSMQRAALSPIGVAAFASVVLALLAWAALGLVDPGQVGFGAQGLGSSRGLVLIAVGLFAVTVASWSRLTRKNDAEL